MGSLERVVSRISPSASPSQEAPSNYYPQAQAPTAPSNLPSPEQAPWAYQAQQAPQTSPNSAYTTPDSSQGSTALSDASLQVIEHFGTEAPGILNQYAITLEDALIAQNERLENVAVQAGAMEHILTDPDQLADYTDRFFTEVYPVNIDEDYSGQPQAYQQQYDMPAPQVGAGGQVQVNPDQAWEGFSQTMDRNPENAYKYLSQMSPELVRSKLLFMDNR